jgi:kynurenine formamidase
MEEPGPGREAAVWLADQEIVVSGTDTMAVDVDPPEDPAFPRVVHQIMLVDRGINLIENLYLDELDESGLFSSARYAQREYCRFRLLDSEQAVTA